MARTVAGLPQGARLTDFISLGVIAATFPLQRIHGILAQTGRASERHRELPAHVMVYYVIALALYMQVSYGEVLRCLLEGVEWLLGAGRRVRATGKSGISQARSRLGSEPLRRLHDETVRPIAQAHTRGAWYRDWRLVSLDGSTLDVADNAENQGSFGRPGSSRGRAAFPQIRVVSLVENGTHVLFGSQLGGCRVGEVTLAKEVLRHLVPGMLCLADRNFFCYGLWKQAAATGADLVWRVKAGSILPCQQRLADGSYLSRIHPSAKARRKHRDGVTVRVVEYTLSGVAHAEPLCRLVTTVLDPEQAPGEELAALYHERWEIETALDELKTHLRGGRIVLRSKTPDLVLQETYGLLLAHFAVRGLMHEAALTADVDCDELSFVHAVRVVRRKLPRFVATSP